MVDLLPYHMRVLPVKIDVLLMGQMYYSAREIENLIQNSSKKTMDRKFSEDEKEIIVEAGQALASQKETLAELITKYIEVLRLHSKIDSETIVAKTSLSSMYTYIFTIKEHYGLDTA